MHLHETSEQGSVFRGSQNKYNKSYAMVKTEQKISISVNILTDLHETFRTGLVFARQSK